MVDLSKATATESIVIDATPDTLYDFIADMPSIGLVSPQCTGGEWESARRGVGAFFIGNNKQGDRAWQTRARVAVAHPHREFAWEQVDQDNIPGVRWGYTFTPVEGGTRVEETWRVFRLTPERARVLPKELLDAVPGMVRDMIKETLNNLKDLFET